MESSILDMYQLNILSLRIGYYTNKIFGVCGITYKHRLENWREIIWLKILPITKIIEVFDPGLSITI